ncbi:hypothetical protein DVA86_10020 [Streptomyces armeniacus]|uniref:RNA polymerase sigma factor 70 region 4 type 2 domain-containing protein n=1 Tax=Streptomyces armeniacus TaxID=83291 RepID=A0A345XMR9_9ACTN|nr:sigma factor-like helix-turn-helix DNA-binding protein [Streptomyces armeniacus]AXK32935.1 hypothetical protein DVA86_10020 [Streptomyces armeniacus]
MTARSRAQAESEAAAEPTAQPETEAETQAEAGAEPAAADGEPPEDPPAPAFDALYARHAPALTRQAYLLCAHRRIAEHAVAHAFHLAWERWPEVAADPDPVGWVRAAAYEYALSPWHQLHPGCRATRAHPGPPGDRAMLDGLMRLPRSYRRALLLHDGLGLSVEETAIEAEASTAAASARIGHAREALGETVPELRQAPEERRPVLIRERLRLLAAAQPVRTPPPRLVRSCSEQTTRRRTRAAVGLTALVAAATAVSWVTCEGRGGAPPEQHAPASPGLPGFGRQTGGAYLPELRSRNHRMRLGEHGPEPVRPTGRPGRPDRTGQSEPAGRPEDTAQR